MGNCIQNQHAVVISLNIISTFSSKMRYRSYNSAIINRWALNFVALHKKKKNVKHSYKLYQSRVHISKVRGTLFEDR